MRAPARLLLVSLLATTPIQVIAMQHQHQSSAVKAPIAYPVTERQEVMETQFGVAVKDPFRWLENDVREDQKVRDWVTAQNKVTDAYLASLPGRDIFAARMKQLYDYERFGVPVKKGGRYFYTRNDGLQNQAPLYVRDSLNGGGRLLTDPNSWSQDGATALSGWVPSDDGKFVAFMVQDGGTDWMTIKVLDVATAKETSDKIEWVKFSNLAWAKDGSGFYYSRFPAPDAAAKFQATNQNQKIYFHKLGTGQEQDRLVFETPEKPSWGHSAEVSEDGKWLVVTTHEGTDDRYQITLIDLAAPAAKPRVLIPGLENNWSFVGNQGNRFFFATNKDAPRLRVVSLDVTNPAPQPVQIIAEDQATLDGVSLVGGQLVASYLVDAKTEVRRYDLGGKLIGKVQLPGIGTAGGFGGKSDDPETFFAFTSFTTPSTIYRYDVKSGQATPWAKPQVQFDPAAFEVAQYFYTSKDGTRVPMFVVRKKGTTGPVPTILYGYGGFNISLTPSYSPTRIAWLEQGGAFAIANLRGGGEYGKAWHDGGRLANKQNVFDDFIAAGEFLVAQGITSKDKLAVQGGSNGGLLVGAVVNQRPDLFAAALPAVGVMDMLRFDRWTAGRYWVDDYGHPSKEADFKTLYGYSPYHNVQSGKDYPAIMVTTADTDDRVVPGHSFKYAAALQAADIGKKPHLIRIETRAGHGSGKPTDKIIEEYADMWAFVAANTGMTVK